MQNTPVNTTRTSTKELKFGIIDKDKLIIEEVTKCSNCRFYGNCQEGMYCGHPYFDDKPAYSDMIITNRNDIPSICPLRFQNTYLKIIIKE